MSVKVPPFMANLKIVLCCLIDLGTGATYNNNNDDDDDTGFVYIFSQDLHKFKRE